MDLIFIFNVALLALGFGFVIFWHELGHFLAAKWAGVRVEQFAVGFGNAIVSFRKGLGVRMGTSGPEYETIRRDDPDRAAAISPTEYRLNYIPLGGYVKMYGQEDMVASTTSTAPDHYMNKTVGQRMVIISAGVVMNVILAAILFTVVFRIGFKAPSATIGSLLPGGPAEKAGFDVGDRILAINGDPQYAWTDVGLSTALLRPDGESSFLIQPAGTSTTDAQEILRVTPSADAGAMGMVGIGIGPAYSLEAVSGRFIREDEQSLRQMLPSDDFAVRPDERIVSVAGTQTGPGDWHVLWNALQASGGQPVSITVEKADGTTEDRTIRPRLMDVMGESFAGLVPRVEVLNIAENSGSRGKLLPGDVVTQVVIDGIADTVVMPSLETMGSLLNAAGRNGRKVDVTVERAGETVTLQDLPLTRYSGGEEGDQYKLLFAPTVDTTSTRLADVAEDSPAAQAGVPAQGVVTVFGGETVSSWFDIRARLREAAENEAQSVSVTVEQNGVAQDYELPLDAEDRATILAQPIAMSLGFVLDPSNLYETTRQTSNPLQAMWWGVRETKNQIVKVYLTLKRVAVDQTVPASNLSGPVGILHTGTILAQNGPTWLLWFLAMISANLAVVNFLPIPILDGGHMVFLASEKITGKPPSPQVQTAALYAGLLLIGGMVLFVTYNDLTRLFG